MANRKLLAAALVPLLVAACSDESNNSAFISLTSASLTTEDGQAYPTEITVDYGAPSLNMAWQVSFSSDAGTYQVNGYLGNVRSPSAKTLFSQTCDSTGALGCSVAYNQVCTVVQNAISCVDGETTRKSFIQERFTSLRIEACVKPEDASKICDVKDFELVVNPSTRLALPPESEATPSLPGAPSLVPPSVLDWNG